MLNSSLRSVGVIAYALINNYYHERVLDMSIISIIIYKALIMLICTPIVLVCFDNFKHVIFCNTKIDGMCKIIYERHSRKGSRFYDIYFSYMWNNLSYTEEIKDPAISKLPKGLAETEVCKIYINPKKPESIRLRRIYAYDLVLLYVGVTFALAALRVFFK